MPLTLSREAILHLLACVDALEASRARIRAAAHDAGLVPGVAIRIRRAGSVLAVSCDALGDVGWTHVIEVDEQSDPSTPPSGTAASSEHVVEKRKPGRPPRAAAAATDAPKPEIPTATEPPKPETPAPATPAAAADDLFPTPKAAEPAAAVVPPKAVETPKPPKAEGEKPLAKWTTEDFRGLCRATAAAIGAGGIDAVKRALGGKSPHEIPAAEYPTIVPAVQALRAGRPRHEPSCTPVCGGCRRSCRHAGR